MKHVSTMCALAVVCLCSIGNAVDGIAVNQASRWIDSYDNTQWPEGAFNYRTDDVQIPGKILRAVITDSRVTSLDTIWNMTQGLAKFPVINMTGTLIAFYRYEAAVVNGVLVNANNPRHISVMDINGQHMRDVATITKPASGGFSEGRIFLDWGSEDWIYYSAPGLSQAFTAAKIYRVRAGDASTNQLVYTYFPNGEGHIDRWTLSADGKRAAINASWQNYSYTNIVTEFPPLNNPLPRNYGGSYPQFGSCNGALSPNGTMLGSFLDGGHTTVYMNSASAGNITQLSGDRADATCNQMSTWAGETVGTGMGYLRWSTNSEKWYSVMPAGCRAACCGGNQVLVNPYDNQAIMITHNQYYSAPPYGGATTVPFSTAGDFWVKGPAGTEGMCEDTLGRWAFLDGTVAAPRSAVPARSGRGEGLIADCRATSAGNLFIRFGNGGPHRIQILDVNGRNLCAFPTQVAHFSMTLPNAPRGIMLVRVTSEQNGRSETVRLSSARSAFNNRGTR